MATLLVLAAGPALSLPQFTPSSTALLHTLGSGQSGTTYNTAAPADQLAYDAGTQILTINGVVDVMNYWDPNNVACATNVGSNCAFNFGPNLALSVQGSYQGVTVTSLGGGFAQVDVNFGTVGTPDITWTDPADGNSVQLAATLQAGIFNGTPTSGLVATTVYDTVSGSVVAPVSAVAFAKLDNATPFASLFGSDPTNRVQLAVSDIQIPGLNAIVANLIATGTLASLTGEINGGQVYRVATGDFVVPEPTTALLLGLGLTGLAIRRQVNAARQAAN